ncbi:uncharacterized protein LOC120174809 [Hibiscus syriacus]|uniref:uncharacterized protein LOC120174809 n=1 Tax=Hibiscus syriacus TaxID=106335 RepID=UPI00192073A8|nr:uncharacterized protein LOC120174809 [Hibiscus syriacus]
MDFIEGFPPSAKHNCILVVIDKFTKYAHFMPLSHPYTVVQVAKIYLDQVYKLHGPPKVSISDRDKSFTSLFWQELLKQLGTTTLFSTAYHPEPDGQTERLNQCLEQYLRRDSRVDVVQTMMQDREQFNALLREQLMQASNRMKQIIDKHRTERDFKVGEEVYLKLQPYRQTSLALRRNLKLAARYFGPYKIQKNWSGCISTGIATRVKIASSVSYLPIRLEFTRDYQTKERVMQFLIQWINMRPDDATWEDYTVLKNQFPNFDHWGQ